MKIAFKIEQFEGPLDLLLNLISREEIDIYDIPIVRITDQYLAYIENMPEMDLDITSEFLLMAATLIEIKSKMLLPEGNASEEDLMHYGHDPREELVSRLIEYKRFKDAAFLLREKEGVLDEVVFKEQEELSPYTKQLSNASLNEKLEKELLEEAILRLMQKASRFDEERSQFFKGIKRDNFTVEEKISFIRGQICEANTVTFNALFGNDFLVEEVVVTFLALLELLKMKEISITQNGIFGDIYIEKKEVTALGEHPITSD